MREKAGQADQLPQESAHGGSVLGRQLLAGFLSGASEVVGLLLFLAVLLFVGTLGPLLYNISSGLRGQIPFWLAVSGLFAQSFGTLPGFIWSARWALLGFGILGLLLALVASQAPRIGRPWRGMLSPIAALGMIGAIVLGLQYANREVLLAWLAGQPYLLNLRDDFLLSDTASLLIGLLATLIGSYIIWSLWQWWYARWARWLRIERQAAIVEAVVEKVAPSESWQAEQARLHRSKRGLPTEEVAAAPSESETTTSQRLLWIFLALVAVATLALLGALQLYNTFGSQLSGRDLFVSTQSPEDRGNLEVNRVPRQVIVSSINGQGSVDITLGSDQQAAVARQIDGMQLTDFGTRSEPAIITMEGLSIGQYRLTVHLRDGSGGQVRYILLQGGGTQAQVAAWLVGLVAGIWLVVLSLAILELFTLRGWFKARSV
jgi:hypothetical protein